MNLHSHKDFYDNDNNNNNDSSDNIGNNKIIVAQRE